jgi:hypothetical protein
LISIKEKKKEEFCSFFKRFKLSSWTHTEMVVFGGLVVLSAAVAYTGYKVDQSLQAGFLKVDDTMQAGFKNKVDNEVGILGTFLRKTSAAARAIQKGTDNGYCDTGLAKAVAAAKAHQ